MSCNPNGFAGNVPTGTVERSSHSLPQPMHTALPESNSSPHHRAVGVPPRAAYSHSASLGSRYASPVTTRSHSTYSAASGRPKWITGRSPRPQPPSGGSYTHPPASTHWSHSANVTSYLPIANACEIVTPVAGVSAAAIQSGWVGANSNPSSSLRPITKEPGGSSTISGHAGQSRNSRSLEEGGCPGWSPAATASAASRDVGVSALSGPHATTIAASNHPGIRGISRCTCSSTC